MSLKANQPAQEAASNVVAETPIPRMTFAEIDIALGKCNSQLKETSTAIKDLLENGAQSIPQEKVQQLRKISSRKSKLIVRRISLLSQSPDTKVKAFLDQLLLIKPQ